MTILRFPERGQYTAEARCFPSSPLVIMTFLYHLGALIMIIFGFVRLAFHLILHFISEGFWKYGY